MATEELPTYERCPNDECGEFIFPETVREYYREEPGGRRADVNVLTLWNENKGFRDDLKVLLKLRREYRKNYVFSITGVADWSPVIASTPPYCTK
jgi:hypothetical protein